MPSQYGEDAILLDYFKDTPRGFLVDVGANDGCLNSNSEKLLALGWAGLLIEPAIAPFTALAAKYQDRPLDVRCLCLAAGPRQARATLWTEPAPSPSQYSTLDPDWRDRCTDRYAARFVAQDTEVVPLSALLDQFGRNRPIDFLSVDCEGWDSAVLQTLDLRRYRPRMICIEGGLCPNPVRVNATAVPEMLHATGYRAIYATWGNTLLVDAGDV